MNNEAKIITRREFLKNSSALCVGAILMPHTLFSQALVPTSLSIKENKSLQLFNINTREFLDVTYFKNGAYIKNALEKINKIMADRRSGQMTEIDVKLIDSLYAIHSQSGAKEPIDIICGYRSPKTNSKLSNSKRGVAKGSYHTLGKAADIKIDGVSLSQAREIAHSLNAGGVGYYPRSGFLHIDVGPLRTWHG